MNVFFGWTKEKTAFLVSSREKLFDNKILFQLLSGNTFFLNCFEMEIIIYFLKKKKLPF